MIATAKAKLAISKESTSALIEEAFSNSIFSAPINS